ncbi:asparaginyl-tRNA synthetase [Agyrium rufum]|nr:asparaginyl-tRNA synthetase [Agyrium rufum]
MAVGISTGSAVKIRGQWRASPSGKEQSHELDAEQTQLVGASDAEKYPIQKKFATPEYLRTIPHLRLRTPANALLLRLKSECDFWATQFFRSKGFTRTQPPLITSSDCEGAGEAFSVNTRDAMGLESTVVSKTIGDETEFFRTPKFLTVSTQLHLEAFVHEHPRVWTLSPTFRAEKSDTPRHLSEFYMLEAELISTSLDEIMDIVEDLIRSIAVSLRASRVGKELLELKSETAKSITDQGQENTTINLNARWTKLERKFWPRITYATALQLLEDASQEQKNLFEHKITQYSGFHLEHERYIAKAVGRGGPVFVTDYPESAKPFYMLPSSTSIAATPAQSTVACFDLLFPEACEVVGGSLREHRLESLVASMKRKGLHPMMNTSGEEAKSSLDWYIDLRRYGSVPHGGFGLGFDRLVGYLAGVPNIRDVVSWPRYYGRCDG